MFSAGRAASSEKCLSFRKRQFLSFIVLQEVPSSRISTLTFSKKHLHNLHKHRITTQMAGKGFGKWPGPPAYNPGLPPPKVTGTVTPRTTSPTTSHDQNQNTKPDLPPGIKYPKRKLAEYLVNIPLTLLDQRNEKTRVLAEHRGEWPGQINRLEPLEWIRSGGRAVVQVVEWARPRFGNRDVGRAEPGTFVEPDGRQRAHRKEFTLFRQYGLGPENSLGKRVGRRDEDEARRKLKGVVEGAGDVKFVGFLGRGGLGVVGKYEVYDTDEDKVDTVVIKMPSGHEKGRTALADEIAIYDKIGDTKHVVRKYDFGRMDPKEGPRPNMPGWVDPGKRLFGDIVGGKPYERLMDGGKLVLPLEFMDMGDLDGWLVRIARAGRTVPELTLWLLFQCCKFFFSFSSWALVWG